ncbi:hypothetical protein JHK87_040523 [Glycine soja]|nr:hypothetical protein JHK87_040523 [Glycine soja]
MRSRGGNTTTVGASKITSTVLVYNRHHHQAFPVIVGTLLGVGAGLLWAEQGAIMTSYPPTNGKASSTWVESLVHGLIPFILNYHRSEAASVNDGTYIGFMCFMLLGTLLSLAILPACKVLRDDGSRCTNMLYSNVSTECVEVLKLFSNWKVLLMVPAAWSSNFFYPYHCLI